MPSSDEEQVNDAEPTAAPTVNALVTAGVGALGDWVSAAGEVEKGASLKAISPLIGYYGERGWLWVGRRAERVREFAFSLRSRARKQGVEAKLSAVADVIEQAIPVVGDTTSEQKRRMVEDVVLNAAHRSGEYGEQIQAVHAMELLDLMPDEAALLFSAMVSELAALPDGATRALRAPLPDVGLPPFLMEQAQDYLQGESENHSFLRVAVKGREPLMWHPTSIEARGTPVTDFEHWVLSAKGEWLAGWVLANEPDPGQGAG